MQSRGSLWQDCAYWLGEGNFIMGEWQTSSPLKISCLSFATQGARLQWQHNPKHGDFVMSTLCMGPDRIKGELWSLKLDVSVLKENVLLKIALWLNCTANEIWRAMYLPKTPEHLQCSLKSHLPLLFPDSPLLLYRQLWTRVVFMLKYLTVFLGFFCFWGVCCFF